MNENTEQSKLSNIIEALLFVSGDPVALDDLARTLNVTVLEAGAVVETLKKEYEQAQRGFCLRILNDKVQLCSNALYAPYIETLLSPPQNKSFSQSVLETLSIVAYKQPVTRAEVEAIRGVRCEYAISQLFAQGLIEEVGRKQTVGRPALLGTTEKFLQIFGIENLEMLPKREEFFEQAAAGDVLEV